MAGPCLQRINLVSCANILSAAALLLKQKLNIMITPENQVPLDDAENSDSADQQSQQDIHSNGFDTTNEGETEYNGEDDADRLQQADKASEAAYTLNIDKGIAPKATQKEDTNIKE
jgi:hypothetical protein